MSTPPVDSRKFSTYSAIALATALGLLAALPSAALEARPSRVEIKAVEDTVSIALTHGGQPVPASGVSSVKFYVENHAYDHMITVSKADGQITIRPTEALELGVYDLRIKTSAGEAVVEVISLQGIAVAGLEARARRQGVTVEEIKAQLGISQTLGRETIDLHLPQSFFVGQTVTVPMTPGPGRTGEWRVNGELVASEGATLSHVLEHAGAYDLAYVEREGGDAVAFGLGTLVVAYEPPVDVALAAGTKTTLHGPAGYTKYEWTTNGVASGTAASWGGAFESPGIYRVRVRASGPEDPGSQAFRVITFEVTVK